MSWFYKTAGKWSDKIALAALLLIALIIAHFVGTGLSALNFSDRIELDYMGIAVSIPAGNGWQSEEKWKYGQSDYTISSFFKAELPNPIMIVNCRYLLAEVESEPKGQIEKKRRSINGSISEKGIISEGQLEINWAKIELSNERTQKQFSIFLGLRSCQMEGF